MVVGMVDAPGARARVDEEVTPQTLGGLLPLVIGVDEEGRFDFDKAVLRPEVRAVLDTLGEQLQGAEYDRLDIIGFTDRIGTQEYNQQLSERRAWAVARYLMDKGVPLAKLRVEGRGERESLLTVGECADLKGVDLIACLQKDRRVQIEASIRRAHVKVE
jgi:OOP family OmpA-OmpF porin